MRNRLPRQLILFPRKGAEALINQLVNFGKEKHDDLADAFVCLVTKMINRDHKLYISDPIIIIDMFHDQEFNTDVTGD